MGLFSPAAGIHPLQKHQLSQSIVCFSSPPIQCGTLIGYFRPDYSIIDLTTNKKVGHLGSRANTPGTSGYRYEKLAAPG